MIKYRKKLMNKVLLTFCLTVLVLPSLQAGENNQWKTETRDDMSRSEKTTEKAKTILYVLHGQDENFWTKVFQHTDLSTGKQSYVGGTYSCNHQTCNCPQLHISDRPSATFEGYDTIWRNIITDSVIKKKTTCSVL